MEQGDSKSKELEELKKLITEGRIDDSVEIIANYLGLSTEENYIEKLENILEVVLQIHGGRSVIRFLIENEIIDIPNLLGNLSKKDSLLRYSFLLLLKDICENEGELFLPFSEDLLNSEDPNVREANLQLLIFMAGGNKISSEHDALIKTIASKLGDEKDFVAEKAVQVLKVIGKKSPSIIAKILGDYIREFPENSELRKRIDDIIKAIVTIEKIEEIVEEEEKEISKFDETEMQKELDANEIDKAKEEILDKKLEIKKKEIEIKIKKLELEEKELEGKSIQEKMDVIKTTKECIEKIEEKPEILEESKISVFIEDEESKIRDKEFELKKKDIELKKKQLELEEKEKELETIAIKEKEKTLRIKEQLLKKEKELSRVEIELKQKELKEKQKEITDKETERIEKKIKKTDEK